MSSHWSTPVVCEAIDRREQQVQGYVEERTSRRAEHTSTPKNHARSFTALTATLSRYVTPWTTKRHTEPDVRLTHR